MKYSDNPVRSFLVSKAIFMAVAGLLLVAGISTLYRRPTNPISSFSLILLGSCILFLALRRVENVFRGKSVLDKVVLLPLPGSAACQLSLPQRMSKGRVILFFEKTTERYSGRISLHKIPPANTAPVAVDLPRLQPSRLKVPKWSPTTDAGEVLENWPRRTGQLADPIVIEFGFSVEPDEKLSLELELESNFKGTKLEDRFPVTGTETVRVLVKE